MPTNGVFQYGIYEGTPRLLNLMDKHNVKLSAFMIGQAVDKDPDLAREVVRRGHEAAAHGRSWTASYDLSPDEERRFIEDNIASIEKATGQTPKGWSAVVRLLRSLPDTGVRCSPCGDRSCNTNLHERDKQYDAAFDQAHYARSGSSEGFDRR